jgi:secondary thiamine-phosphate synthase enzyme
MKTLELKTTRRIEFVDITAQVKQAVKQAGVENGLCLVFVPHTTAGVTVNENADISVQKDINNSFSALAPHPGKYLHTEGNADAHIKSALTGTSLTLIVENSKLVLGQWQAVFFCEYDGPRSRKVHIKITND